MAVNDPEGPQEPAAKVRVLPPVVFVSALAVAITLTHTVGRLWTTHALSGLRSLLGLVLLFGGVTWLLYCVRLMRQTGQHPSPKKPTPSLITTGPWSRTRNPIYLGMTSVLLGFGLMLNNTWVVVFAFVALWIVHRTAVLPEEAYLAERFGEAYREYQKTVPRYL